jgi:disulfide bond formation protein DsbB
VLNTLACIGRSAYYWLAIVLFGLSSEGVALYYQYVKEEWPCVLCIQMRLWVLLLTVIALLVLLLRRFRYVVMAGHILITLTAVGMLERSWQLLGIERGFLEGNCSFDLGLPSWLTPDKWIPSLFEVQTTCGYTPQLLFGITMAEALIVISALLLLIAVAMIVATALRARR